MNSSANPLVNNDVGISSRKRSFARTGSSCFHCGIQCHFRVKCPSLKKNKGSRPKRDAPKKNDPNSNFIIFVLKQLELINSKLDCLTCSFSN